MSEPPLKLIRERNNGKELFLAGQRCIQYTQETQNSSLEWIINFKSFIESN